VVCALSLAAPLLSCSRTQERAAPADVLWLPEPSSFATVDSAATVAVDTFPEILSVADARRTDRGWVLLDRRARHVHVLDDDGDIMTFSREGDGPGELRLPLALAATETLLAVADASERRVSFFSPEGAFVGEASLRHPSCPFGTLAGLAAGPTGSVFALLTCTGLDGSMDGVLFEARPGEGTREIARQVIQKVSGEVDPLRGAVVGLHRGAAYMGVVPDPCLERVWPEPRASNAPRRICASDAPGPPLPDSLRARLEAISDRLRPSGRSVLIPDALPPFLDVSSAPPRMALRVALADGSHALDVLEVDGRVSRIALPGDARTFLAPEGLLLVRDLLVGSELTRLVFQ
jgi:hypothetical protein